MVLQRRSGRSFLKHVWISESALRSCERGIKDVLSMTRLLWSARTPWTMGNENLPSVRSSANPLFFEYYRIAKIDHLSR